MAGTDSMTHTPGPWKQGKTDPLNVSVNGTIICRCAAVSWENVGRANARLIAAAPDLLAALKVERERFDAVLEAIEQMSDGGDMTNLAFHYRIVGLFTKTGDGDLMRAAIAKAEGET